LARNGEGPRERGPYIVLQAHASHSRRERIWGLPARSRLLNSILDISPSNTGTLIPQAATMPTLRSMAEMGLLVGTAVAVLVIATMVL
jgi:hypothetical protein